MNADLLRRILVAVLVPPPPGALEGRIEQIHQSRVLIFLTKWMTLPRQESNKERLSGLVRSTWFAKHQEGACKGEGRGRYGPCPRTKRQSLICASYQELLC